MPRFPGPAGWTVAGKTDCWIERDGQAPYVFVRRKIGLAPAGSFGGAAARAPFLDSLPL